MIDAQIAGVEQQNVEQASLLSRTPRAIVERWNAVFRYVDRLHRKLVFYFPYNRHDTSLQQFGIGFFG